MKRMHTLLILLLLVIQHVYVYATCSTDDVQNLYNIHLRANEVTDQAGLINDENLDEQWYGVVYNGYQYLMVDSTNKPTYGQCGTYYPIYIKGTHPPVDNLTQEINVVACRRNVVSPCELSYNIRIRKCSDEIQYYLRQTGPYSGYCFSKHSTIDTPAGPPNDVQLGKVTVQPKIAFMENSILNMTATQYDPYFVIICNFTEQHYYYNVNWYIDGTFLISYGPSNVTSNLVFKESLLWSHSLSLGFDISCGVSVQSSEDGAQTDMMFSDIYFAGIKILTSPIYIDKGSKEESLRIKATIPIGCSYDTMIGPKICTGSFRVWNEAIQECSFEGTVTSKKCASNIKTLSINDTWNPDEEFEFKIVTTDMNYDDGRVFNLRLMFNNLMGHKIWRDYIFPNVQVFVNTGQYKGNICYSHIDPHMKTADGTRYEQQKVGYFMLYINTVYGIEVQERTVKCNNNIAVCTCGVAIKAGKDVFRIDRCGKVSYLGFTACGDGGILQVVRANDYKYKVFTPIGTRITITLYANLMNVDITMAPKDMNNIAGLCGKFDNIATNDLQHRDGTFSTYSAKRRHYYAFSDSWRLSDDENLFINGDRTLDSWEQHNGLYCSCNENAKEALCSQTQYLNCTMKNSITGTKCFAPNRRKRNTNSNQDREIKRLFSLMVPKDGQDPHVIRKREEDADYITTELAKAVCTNEINNSIAVKSYGEVGGNDNPNAVIDECTFDVKIGRDTSWAKTHVESVNSIANDMIELQPVYVANNKEKVETFFLNTCPGNCSDNGNCTITGVCACYGFYHGADCTIDERDALHIDDIEFDGECDLADGDECICFHVRSNNILEGIQCTSRSAKISTNNTVEIVSTRSYPGGYEDIFTAVCCIGNPVGTDDVYVAMYDVSISNDGVTYSNEKTVYVYDSTCQEIEVQNNGSRLFTLKNETCFIDNHCVVENEMSLTGCEACQSSTAVYSWSDYNPCQHGGSCTDADFGYTCTCMDGYDGMNCESEIDECVSNPCLNGGSCTDLFRAYNCSCAPGFAGTNCETNTNECTSQPCQHEGTCSDGINMYTCTCANGYAGIHCDTDVDECASNPCQNGGVCNDEVNMYTCTCTNGYRDIHCETDIDECSSNPCQHDGSCTDGVNGYTCTCATGYFGVVCETDVDECATNSCQNGGSCTDMENGRTCTCSPGYSGTNCETDTNECASNPCANGGSCRDLINEYSCICRPGYEGSSCETNIDECESSPCLNNGICGDLVDGYRCSCLPGYEGTHCELNIDECASTPCHNDGSCIDSINGYMCTCQSGYEGSHCELNANECVSNPCLNGGTCEDLINEYKCVCVAGYQGTSCGTDINECSSNPCQNGGSCEDLVNKYSCSCLAGYQGTKCERDTDECATYPCLNDGRCEDRVNGYVCFCRAGYEDINCGTDIDECASSPCLNNGTCEDLVNGYTCSCLAGYQGTLCESNIDECLSNPCQHEGNCVDGVNGYTCTCTAGYGGGDCETDINECLSNPCQHEGNCVDGVNGYTCTCTAGYGGDDCETDINECISNPCQHEGNCVDGVNGYTCTCTAGYGGDTCETDIDECSSNPCQHDGSCTDGVNSYTCTCVAGYFGADCETDTAECASNPCMNGGTCVDQVNMYKCTCVDGYIGTHCGTVVPILSKAIQASMVFPIDSSDINLTDPIIEQEIVFELSTFFQRFMRELFKAIRIIDIRYGSLVVEFEVEYFDTPTAISGFTAATTSLINGHDTVTLLNEKVAATTLLLQEQTFTKESLNSSSGHCELFLIINGDCEENHFCTLVEGSPACVMKDTKFGLAMVVAIGICVFSVLTAVCTLSCLIIRMVIMRQKKANKPSARQRDGSFEESRLGNWPHEHSIGTHGSIGGPLYKSYDPVSYMGGAKSSSQSWNNIRSASGNRYLRENNRRHDHIAGYSGQEDHRQGRSRSFWTNSDW